MTTRLSDFVASLTDLHAVVASLGSKDVSAWWNSSFLSPTGLEMLAFNFPRTAVSAAVTSTAKAAAQQHDQAAGAVGVFHLFRLPAALMGRVHRQLIGNGANLAEILTDKERCLETLRGLAGNVSTPDLGPGARDLGRFEVEDPALITRLAAAYLAAFTDGYKTFPYFTLD